MMTREGTTVSGIAFFVDEDDDYVYDSRKVQTVTGITPDWNYVRPPGNIRHGMSSATAIVLLPNFLQKQSPTPHLSTGTPAIYGDISMAFQLECPEDAFMVRADDRDEVFQMAKNHVEMHDHDMSDDDIHNAIMET